MPRRQRRRCRSLFTQHIMFKRIVRSPLQAYLGVLKTNINTLTKLYPRFKMAEIGVTFQSREMREKKETNRGVYRNV